MSPVVCLWPYLKGTFHDFKQQKISNSCLIFRDSRRALKASQSDVISDESLETADTDLRTGREALKTRGTYREMRV